MLGHVPVGAGQQHPEVGVVGAGVPHLLAVDDPLVAVELGAGGQPGEVGAGARLAEQLAPRVLAGERSGAGTARCSVVGAVGSRIVGAARPMPVPSGSADRADGAELAGDDVVGPRRQAPPVPLGRPRRHRPAGVEQPSRQARSDSAGSQLAVHPGAHVGAQRLLRQTHGVQILAATRPASTMRVRSPPSWTSGNCATTTASTPPCTTSAATDRPAADPRQRPQRRDVGDGRPAPARHVPLLRARLPRARRVAAGPRADPGRAPLVHRRGAGRRRRRSAARRRWPPATPSAAATLLRAEQQHPGTLRGVLGVRAGARPRHVGRQAAAVEPDRGVAPAAARVRVGAGGGRAVPVEAAVRGRAKPRRCGATSRCGTAPQPDGTVKLTCTGETEASIYEIERAARLHPFADDHLPDRRWSPARRWRWATSCRRWWRRSSPRRWATAAWRSSRGDPLRARWRTARSSPARSSTTCSRTSSACRARRSSDRWPVDIVDQGADLLRHAHPPAVEDQLAHLVDVDPVERTWIQL